MKAVFADSYFFFALANPNDPTHARAVDFAKSYTGRTVTTGWIITEVGDGWSKPPERRQTFLQILAELKTNPNTIIVASNDELLQEGIDLFAHRHDKEWTLTDCISFVVMKQQGINEALTGDRHFEQAGFVALLK
jgi:predicted nucleic acid-binding protein